MPDFFGHDVIFDPRRFKSDTVTPPAENFLLNMQAGGEAIVMCVWQGPLSLGKEKKVEEKDNQLTPEGQLYVKRADQRKKR